jgi:hypothetical protein
MVPAWKIGATPRNVERCICVTNERGDVIVGSYSLFHVRYSLAAVPIVCVSAHSIAPYSQEMVGALRPTAACLGRRLS